MEIWVSVQAEVSGITIYIVHLVTLDRVRFDKLAALLYNRLIGHLLRDPKRQARWRAAACCQVEGEHLIDVLVPLRPSGFVDVAASAGLGFGVRFKKMGHSRVLFVLVGRRGR